MRIERSRLTEVLEIITEMQEVLEVLSMDRQISTDYIRSHDGKPPSVGHSGFWARTLVRNLVADVEARVFQLRRACLAINKLGRGSFTPEEIVCLNDENLRIERGIVKIEKAKTRTSEGVLFAFNMLARATEIDNPIDTANDPMWPDFLYVLKIRDRFTHPKRLSDLSATAGELNKVANVMKWFQEKMGGVLTEGIRKIKEFLADLEGFTS
jgi:hypothetical protein